MLPNFTSIFGGQPDSNNLVQRAPSRDPDEDGDAAGSGFRTVGEDDNAASDGPTGPLGRPSGEPEPYDG